MINNDKEEKFEIKNFDEKSKIIEIEMNDYKTKSGKGNKENILTNNNLDKPLLNNSISSKRNLLYYFVLIMGFLIGISFDNVSDVLFSWKKHSKNGDLESDFWF